MLEVKDNFNKNQSSKDHEKISYNLKTIRDKDWKDSSNKNSWNIC